ncbi:MAG: BspA family leucine-rich repeat surface protein, partial [Prevotellaceae bacterium]|nr:BspA family leucine-rich repeat surface protein [Prevotellaceae bacterium]MDY5210750.1 BspA family leucine-rich repeat surface protein [Prevotella sp.]
MNKKITQLRWLAATLLFVTAMVMPTTAWAQTMYTVFDTETGTLTFKYDNSKPESTDTQKVYDVPTEDPAAINPGWNNNHASGITKVVFDASFANARPVYTKFWFYNCNNLSEIVGIQYLNTSEVTDMHNMFAICSSLTSLDLSGFDTGKVTDMGMMFFNCSKLKTIYVSDSFTTVNVTSSSQMFHLCTLLSGACSYNSGNANDANYAKYTTGYFTKYGTVVKGSYVVYLEADNTLTFKYGEIPASGDGSTVYSIPSSSYEPEWISDHASDIKKVVFDESFAVVRPTNCYCWFTDCSALTDIQGIQNLNTTEVTNMGGMFYNCSNLTSLDLSGFDTQRVSEMNSMFFGCSKLTTIFVSDKFVVENVTQSDNMFSFCDKLSGAISYDYQKTNKEYANCTTGYFTNIEDKDYFMHHAVYNSGAKSLTFKYGNKNRVADGITTYELNTGNTEPGWKEKTDIEVVTFEESFKDARPESCHAWLKGLSSLSAINNIEYLNTEECTDMAEMFSGCSTITKLDLRTFDTRKVTDMSAMFSGCGSLTKIDVTGLFDVANVTSSEGMFTGCTRLKGVIAFDENHVDKTYANGEGYFTKQPDGEGTQASPYLIGTITDLVWFRNHVNEGNLEACAKLTADIDMSTACHPAGDGVEELSWTPISDENKNINWRGFFDGDGHTISNLYINSQSSYQGLFGYISGLSYPENVRSAIKNVVFENVNVKGTSNFYGALAGYAYTFDIIGVTVNSGTIEAVSNRGGIIGYAGNSNLKSCVNRASVTGTGSGIGGICGELNSTLVSQCANYGNVKGYTQIGGIAGKIYQNTTIENSITVGDIASSHDNAGWVVGQVFENATLTISGVVAFNSDAQMTSTTKNAIYEILDGGSVTGECTGYTTNQLKSGETVIQLNGGKTDGTQAWYQNLSEENADVYPVLTNTGSNTVYGGFGHGGTTGQFSNTESEIPAGYCHTHAYDPNAENEASGNHNKSYEGQFTWTDNDNNATATAIFTCSVCGKVVEPELTVEHDDSHTNTEADCLNNGFKYYKTSYAFDGNTISDTYMQTITALGHDMPGNASLNPKQQIYQKVCQRNGCGVLLGYYATSDGNVVANETESGFVAEALTLEDAKKYDNQAVFTATDFKYTRTFSNTNWTTWYVPFELPLTSEICSKFAFSRINNVHQYDTDNDGKADKTVVESFRQTAGVTLKANYPYLVKALSESDLSMVLNLTDVQPALAEEKSIDCQSVDYTYVFTGTYNGEGESGATLYDPYTLYSDGTWQHYHSLEP